MNTGIYTHQNILGKFEQDCNSIKHLENLIEEKSRTLFNKRYSKLKRAFDEWLGPDNTVEYVRDGKECTAKWYSCEFVIINTEFGAEQGDIILISSPSPAITYQNIKFKYNRIIATENELLRIVKMVDEYNSHSWLVKKCCDLWITIFG